MGEYPELTKEKNNGRSVKKSNSLLSRPFQKYVQLPVHSIISNNMKVNKNVSRQPSLAHQDEVYSGDEYNNVALNYYLQNEKMKELQLIEKKNNNKNLFLKNEKKSTSVSSSMNSVTLLPPPINSVPTRKPVNKPKNNKSGKIKVSQIKLIKNPKIWCKNCLLSEGEKDIDGVLYNLHNPDGNRFKDCPYKRRVDKINDLELKSDSKAIPLIKEVDKIAGNFIIIISLN